MKPKKFLLQFLVKLRNRSVLKSVAHYVGVVLKMDLIIVLNVKLVMTILVNIGKILPLNANHFWVGMKILVKV